MALRQTPHPPPLTQEASRHGIAEHHQMDPLESTDFSSPAWLVAARDYQGEFVSQRLKS